MNRVLIINDSRFESIILSDQLSQIGYNVLVSDEYNAVKQVQSFAPDVVLVNYTMREITGDKLIERIKAVNAATKCILTSNSSLTMDDVSRKVDFILRTPANRHNLEAAIREVERKKEAVLEDDKELKNLRERIDRWKSSSGQTHTEEVIKEIHIEDTSEEAEEILKFCPYCGHKFDEDQTNEFAFCPFCGHKIGKTS